MPRLGEKLADDVLDRRRALPRKPDGVTLEGEIVKLVPLDLERDLDGLCAASDGRPNSWGERRAGSYDPDHSIWRYMPGRAALTASRRAAGVHLRGHPGRALHRQGPQPRHGLVPHARS
jgi:hypothetical protein